jgi:hypothetical protein
MTFLTNFRRRFDQARRTLTIAAFLYGYRNRCATDAEHWQPVGAQQNDGGTWRKRRDGDHPGFVPWVRTLAVHC